MPCLFSRILSGSENVIADKELNLRSLIHQAGFRELETFILFFFLKYATKSLRKDVLRMLDMVIPM